MFGSVHQKYPFILPVLKVNDCNLADVKCNNKLINNAIKQKIYHDCNRALFKTLPDVDNKSVMIDAHSEFKKWPIPHQSKRLTLK